MGSAGKWVLGLLLLVVGAVGVARLVSTSDGGSQAEVKNLPAAQSAAQATDTAKKATDTAKKATAATGLSCKTPCVEGAEIAKDSVTTDKLAPGAVTLSKLAFEVPNLNELENEINARKAAEVAAQSAQDSLATETAKNDAAITAAAQTGLAGEAAARTAGDEKLASEGAAADADLLSKLNKEIADRGNADDAIQLNLNNEIAARQSSISTLRGELGNGTQVPDASVVVKINNNELVGNAVTTDKVLDNTLTAADLATDSVTSNEIDDETITGADLATDSVGTLEIADNTVGSVDIKNGSVALGDLAFTPALEAALLDLIDDLASNDGDPPNAGSNLVHWNNLNGVPDDVVTRKAADLDCNAASGCVDSSDIKNSAVTSAKIDDNTITAADLAVDAVTSDEIADGTITADDITTDDANALTGAQIKNGSIGANELATSAVSGGNAGTIVDNSVTAADLATDSVTADELANGAVDRDAILDGAVNTDKIEANAGSDVVAAPAVINAGAVDSPAATTTLDLTAGKHKVLVTGQLLAACNGCTGAGDTVTLTVSLADNGTTFGPLYAITLTNTAPTQIIATSGLRETDVAAATHTYTIAVDVVKTGVATGMTATQGTLSALDAGR